MDVHSPASDICFVRIFDGRQLGYCIDVWAKQLDVVRNWAFKTRPAFVLSQPKVTDGLSAPFMLSPTSVILYESLMDVSSAMTLMSGQNNLTWFATELSKQAPHWSCQSRVTDGLSAPFMLSPTSVILYKSLMDVSSAMTLMSEQNNLTRFVAHLSKEL